MMNYELAEKDYQAGMKYKDIATKYNVTLNTVKSWKTRYWKNKTEEKESAEKVCTQNKSMHTLEKGAENKISDEDKDFEWVDEEDGLTDKQRNFCYCYYESFNATQAAIKAGYSEKTAAEQGCRLLKKVKVKEFLEKLREAYRTEFLLTQERVMNRHMQIAFSDMRDFITEDGKLRKNYDGTLIKKMTIRSSNYSDGEVAKEDRTVTIELEDRKQSFSLLTKKLNLDPDTNIAKERLEIEKDKVYGTGNGENKASGNIEKAKNILIKLRGNNESNR